MAVIHKVRKLCRVINVKPWCATVLRVGTFSQILDVWLQQYTDPMRHHPQNKDIRPASSLAAVCRTKTPSQILGVQMQL